MSGIMNPVGPEAPQTYWLRRVGVIGAAVLLIALLVWVFRDPGGSTAVPASESSPATVPSSASSPPASPSATPSATAAPSSTPSSAASEAPAVTVGIPTAPAQPTPTPSGVTRSASVTPQPTATQKAVTACNPQDLRVTLTAKRVVNAKKDTLFALSVINGGSTACAVTLTQGNFELKVYSGTDRIWSTNDCATWLPPVKAVLQPERDVAWQMKWPGVRSDKQCKVADETLRPGTYVATARLKDAKPVQHVMNLR